MCDSGSGGSAIGARYFQQSRVAITPGAGQRVQGVQPHTWGCLSDNHRTFYWRRRTLIQICDRTMISERTPKFQNGS